MRDDWTTDELAAILQCSRGQTTGRMKKLESFLASIVLADPEALSPTGRSDRVAAAAMAQLRAFGRLAAADPDGARRMIRDILDARDGQSDRPAKSSRVA